MTPDIVDRLRQTPSSLHDAACTMDEAARVDNTRRVLERGIGGKLDFHRLALTVEQVEEHKLEPIIKRDHRYNDGHPHEAVETEAISQRILIDILRARLEALLPEPLGRVQEHEERQRRRILNLLQKKA